MFPRVGRELFGEGARQGALAPEGTGAALLLQGQSTLGTELNTAWASARGKLNAALGLHVSASAPSARLREVQVKGGSFLIKSTRFAC
jgi:hypothetical protein